MSISLLTRGYGNLSTGSITIARVAEGYFWTGQVQKILKGIVPKMKSGSHVCILNVQKVSSVVLSVDKFSSPRSK